MIGYNILWITSMVIMLYSICAGDDGSANTDESDDDDFDEGPC